MYNFRDVTETTSEGVSLPSEALKINGEYIENLISGYRTLTVEGREALSPEITTNETGIRDGSTLKGKRYPARIIRITYQLIAASNEAFREAYNKLASILDVKDAELIFDDEPDKFFTGTPSYIGEVEPGKNAVVGEFEILCADPFKYSVLEYVVAPEQGETSVVIDYGGTYKGFPTLEADFFNEDEASEDGETVTELTGSGDCGYVAFFNEDEKIIQIGDPDEVDGEAVAKSQTLFNQQFTKSSSWGSAAQSLWGLNKGITSSDAVVQAGAMGMEAVPNIQTLSAALGAAITLLKAKSTAEAPYIHYAISAKTTERTENSVKVNVTVDTRLDNAYSYFGKGYSLSGSVYIGGSWHDMVLKESSEYWRSTTVHKKSFTATVTGLDVDTNKLTGIKFKAWRTDGAGGKSGVLSETACADLQIPEFMKATADTYYLAPVNFGTGSDWHGPSITRTIPADATDEVGAANFTLTYEQKMFDGSKRNHRIGAFQVLLVSGSGTGRKIVAGVNVYKGSKGKNAKLRFYINNKVVETRTIDLSTYGYNLLTQKGKKQTATITKTGNKVSFNIWGNKAVYRDNAITDTAVTEVTFTFSRFGIDFGVDTNGDPLNEPLIHNGLYWAKFVKNNCDTYKDVPNKFSANDVLEADCKTGEIFLNGVATPSLGALGNDWEGFYLTPGVNQIGFSHSDWVAAGYAPTFKVKYREVFL